MIFQRKASAFGRTVSSTPLSNPATPLFAEAIRLPKVSIVTVCFNSSGTIRDTIESVLSQDYRDIEYIVVDGGSRDGTVEIVREYGERISVFVSEPDRGVYDAMNKGVLLASGDIIGMLNSDDLYVDTRVVSDLVTAMRAANVDAVFADLLYVDPSDTGRVLRYYDSGQWRPGRFRFGWMPAHPTFFIKREWYEREGLYCLSYRIAADFEMLVRLLRCGRASYTHVARPVVLMRTGGMSTRPRGIRHRWLHNCELVRACRTNGIWTTLPLMLLRGPGKLLEKLRGRSLGRVRARDRSSHRAGASHP